MRIIGRITALLLALLAIPMLTMASCNLAIERTLLAEETYRGLLDDDAIFEDFLSVVLPALMEVAEENQASLPPPPDHFNPENADNLIQLQDITSALNPEARREVVSILVPSEWLQARTQQVFGIITGIMSENFTVLEETIDFDEIRRRWTGTEAADAAQIIVEQAMPCTRTQLDQLRSLLSDGEGTLPICNPNDAELSEQSQQLIQDWLGVVASQLPEEAPTVAEFFDIKTDDIRALSLLIELDRQGLILLFLAPAALLALIVIFTVRSLKGLGAWFGSISLTTGVIIFAVIFALQVLLLNSLSQLLRPTNEVERFLSRVGSEFLVSAFGQSSNTLIWQAGIYLALGFVLLLIAFFSRKPHNPMDNSYVLVTEDGQIISTATQKRVNELIDSQSKKT